MAKMRQPLENPVMCGETWQHCDSMERKFVEFKDFLQQSAIWLKNIRKSFPTKTKERKEIDIVFKRFNEAHLFFYKEGIPEPKDFYDKPSRMHGHK